MNNNYFKSYIQSIQENIPTATSNITKESNLFDENYLQPFNYREHQTGLLLGNVQSGKTSQVLGIISKAADRNFQLFILLTTDNVELQQQTYKRCLDYLDGPFKVCGEEDTTRFFSIQNRRPVIIVIKKNYRILGSWLNNIAQSGYAQHRPIFIIDDEGDAASLNTLVNKDEQSTINRILEDIRNLAASSIYLQVTATPQALLLQQESTQWKPSFYHYFPPGKEYLGGDFFFSHETEVSEPEEDNFIPYPIKFTGENELTEILNSNETPTNLKLALTTFLLIAAHKKLNCDDPICNFLIHPSFKISDHKRTLDKISDYLTYLLHQNLDKKLILEAYKDLRNTKPDIQPINQLETTIKDILANNLISKILFNSQGQADRDYQTGINIIVGGNSLGRGVTFPNLEVVYYCRRAKTPQADTSWQHCRMFGYNRDRNLVRVFLPPSLFHLFSQLNQANNLLINQVKEKKTPKNVFKDKNIRPTRRCVINDNYLYLLTGGVNYFPFEPLENNHSKITDILDKHNFITDINHSNIKTVKEIISVVDTASDDSWQKNNFIDCLNALMTSTEQYTQEALIIIRKNRDIRKGTGTLLSPNDRHLGKSHNRKTVLTIYEIRGSVHKGWKGHPFWILNIKLPNGLVFWDLDE